MKEHQENLGYAMLLALMITVSTLVLILGVAGLLIGEEPVWLSIVGTIVGSFTLFGWTTLVVCNLIQLDTGDKNETEK